MTRMTGPDCVVMCNLINTYIHTYIHTYIRTYIHTYIHTYILQTYIHARPGREEDTARLGQADARRLGGRHAGRTDLIPLR